MNFADPGPRRSVSFLLLLPLLLAAQPVATDGYLPALPEIARDLGSASSSLTVFMLAFGVAQLVCGPLADRFGRRPVLLTGLACYTAAAAGCALAGSADALVAWRAVQGAAMAAILVCARAAVRDLYPAHEGPRIMARGLMGLGLVALVAPIAGAWGVQATGWRWVLVAMGVYSLALLALCWRTFSETRQAPAESAPVLASVPVSVSAGGVRQVIADPAFAPGRHWPQPPTAASSAFAAVADGVRRPVRPVARALRLDSSGRLAGLHPRHHMVPAPAVAPRAGAHGAAGRFAQSAGAVHPDRRLRAGAGLARSIVARARGVCAGPWPAPALRPGGRGGGLPPQLAGRAVSCSGFAIMCVAFCAGQLAAQFVDPTMRHGAWPMVLPMALAGVVLVLIAFVWLPRLYRVGAAQRVQPRS